MSDKQYTDWYKKKENDLLKAKLQYSTEKIELHDKEIINMSYLVTAMVDTEEQVTDMEQYLMKFYDSKKIQIMPGAGRAKEIFFSSSSLGLRDFSSMQNVNCNMISDLLL